MLRLLLVLMALSLATVVQADVSIHIEDFEKNGEPGFDPMFNHYFSAYHPSLPVLWDFLEETSSPGDTKLALWAAKDMVLFSLSPEQSVDYASVDIVLVQPNIEF